MYVNIFRFFFSFEYLTCISFYVQVERKKDVVVSLSGPIGDASAVANLNNQTMSMIMANGEEKSKKKTHTHTQRKRQRREASRLPIIVRRCDERRRSTMVNIVRARLFSSSFLFFLLSQCNSRSSYRHTSTNERERERNGVRCKQTPNRRATMAEKEEISLCG